MVEIHSSATIDAMRRLNSQNLPLDAELLYEAKEDDGSGGKKSFGWFVYDKKCCRISPVNAEDRILADQYVTITQWWVIFNWDVAIPFSNRIQIGDRLFRIIGDMGIRTNQVMAKFLCIETKPDEP